MVNSKVTVNQDPIKLSYPQALIRTATAFAAVNQSGNRSVNPGVNLPCFPTENGL